MEDKIARTEINSKIKLKQEEIYRDLWNIVWSFGHPVLTSQASPRHQAFYHLWSKRNIVNNSVLVLIYTLNATNTSATQQKKPCANCRNAVMSCNDTTTKIINTYVALAWYTVCRHTALKLKENKPKSNEENCFTRGKYFTKTIVFIYILYFWYVRLAKLTGLKDALLHIVDWRVWFQLK